MGYAPCLYEVQSHDWITTEVSQALHEELPHITKRFMDRLVARFEGRRSAVHVVKGMVGVAQETEISSI